MMTGNALAKHHPASALHELLSHAEAKQDGQERILARSPSVGGMPATDGSACCAAKWCSSYCQANLYYPWWIWLYKNARARRGLGIEAFAQCYLPSAMTTGGCVAVVRMDHGRESTRLVTARFL